MEGKRLYSSERCDALTRNPIVDAVSACGSLAVFLFAYLQAGVIAHVLSFRLMMPTRGTARLSRASLGCICFANTAGHVGSDIKAWDQSTQHLRESAVSNPQTEVRVSRAISGARTLTRHRAISGARDTYSASCVYIRWGFAGCAYTDARLDKT